MPETWHLQAGEDLLYKQDVNGRMLALLHFCSASDTGFLLVVLLWVFKQAPEANVVSLLLPGLVILGGRSVCCSAGQVVCCLIFEELDYFDGMICQKPVGDVAAGHAAGFTAMPRIRACFLQRNPCSIHSSCVPADAHHRLLATTVEEDLLGCKMLSKSLSMG